MKATLLFHLLPKSEMSLICLQAKAASIPNSGNMLEYIQSLKTRYNLNTKEAYELTFFAKSIIKS